MTSRFSEDVGDISRGIKALPIAFWMAGEDLRSRYARTVLGPWWNVLSNVLFVFGMAITFGSLFRQPLEVYLPYVAAGMAFWGFLNQSLVESPNLLPRAASMIQSFPLPLSLQVFRSVCDRFIMLAHFLLVYVGVALLVGLTPDPLALLFIFPALLIYTLFALGVGFGLSVLGARFRDIGPALSSVMVIAFMITPIFWQKQGLTGPATLIADLNPLFHLLEIGRNPLLGQYTDLHHWIVSICVSVGVFAAGLLTFTVYRRQIYFWL